MGKDTNITVQVGCLTRDPETRYTSGGKAVTNFSIANNNSYYNANKELVEEVSFFNITVWGKQAENCAKFLHKGSRVCASGRLKQDRWVDQQTQANRSKVEIVADNVQFLSPVQNQQQGQDQNGNNQNQRNQQPPQQNQHINNSGYRQPVNNQNPPANNNTEPWGNNQKNNDDIPF